MSQMGHHSMLLGVLLLCCGKAYAICGAGPVQYERKSDGWYYFRTRVDGADAATFRILPEGSEPFYNPCMRDSGYAVDKHHAYRGAHSLSGSNPVTFSVLTFGYSRDASHVYYLESLVDGADAASFHQLASGFFKDSEHVYLNGIAIKGADSATFTALGNTSFPGLGLAHDANHVYFGASAIAGADASDVNPLGNEYWISNGKVFFADHPLPQVDPDTFIVPPEDELAYSAEDKNHYFLSDRAYSKLECRKVGEIVLACKDYILSRGRGYSVIDPKSIHYLGRFPHRCQVIENSLIYQDIHGLYEMYGDGTIMKFIGLQPEKRFEKMDDEVIDLLCKHAVTQSV